MINKDVKENSIVENINNNGENKMMTSEDKSKFMELVKKGWDAFHRYVAYALITCAIGVYIGVTISKVYYSNKMKESIAVGGIVFEKEVYSINKK